MLLARPSDWEGRSSYRRGPIHNTYSPEFIGAKEFLGEPRNVSKILYRKPYTCNNSNPRKGRRTAPPYWFPLNKVAPCQISIQLFCKVASSLAVGSFIGSDVHIKKIYIYIDIYIRIYKRIWELPQIRSTIFKQKGSHCKDTHNKAVTSSTKQPDLYVQIFCVQFFQR